MWFWVAIRGRNYFEQKIHYTLQNSTKARGLRNDTSGDTDTATTTACIGLFAHT